MSYRSRKRKPIAEINVVPYIDVMLVLLIIFMVTAPLLTEGVQIDLPQTDSEAINFNPDAPEPLIFSIDADGKYYIDDDETSAEDLYIYARAAYENNPTADFLVRGDKAAVYDDVMQLINILKRANIETINLVTSPPEEQ